MQSTFVLAKKKPLRVVVFACPPDDELVVSTISSILSPSILTLHLNYLTLKKIICPVRCHDNKRLSTKTSVQSKHKTAEFISLQRRSITGGHGKLNLCERKSMCQDC